jgi:DNA-binding transcriptional LysR family regulator
MRMNLDDMRAFVAAVETGSVGKAALRLHLTQPAVSRRIQRLEEALDTTLLDRDSKPAKPTRAGEAAYRHCVAVLRATAALERNARGTTAASPLRVGVTFALSESVFAPAIEAVRKRCPEISLRLTADRSAALRKQLRDGQLDAAIVVSRLDRLIDDPSAVPLGTERVLVVVSKDSRLAHRIKLSDLAGMPWVINPEGCGFRAQLEGALAESGLTLEVIVESWGVVMQLALVAAGVGVGLIPERMIMDSRYRGSVRAVSVQDLAPAVAIWMVKADELGPLEAAVEVVAETVRRLLAAPSKKGHSLAVQAHRRTQAGKRQNAGLRRLRRS